MYVEIVGISDTTWTKDIRLKIITTTKTSNKFSQESPYTSNTFSRESSNFPRGFQVSKRSPRHSFQPISFRLISSHRKGWLRLVRSLKLYVSFAKEPYKSDCILQKRPIILRSLLIVAIPHPYTHNATPHPYTHNAIPHPYTHNATPYPYTHNATPYRPRRAFDPCTPLLFDLSPLSRTKRVFWISTRKPNYE